MKQLIVLLLIIVTASCSKEPSRTFTPAEPTPPAATTDLAAFLRNAPFANEWRPDEGDKDRIVITNIENVFPNLGKFRNASDTFNSESKHDKPNDYYEKETVVYQDPT